MLTGFVVSRTSGIKWYLRATNPPTWTTVKAEAILWRTEAEALVHMPLYPNRDRTVSNCAIEPAEREGVETLARQPMTDERCRRLQEAGAAMLRAFVGLTDDVRTYADGRHDSALSALVQDAISACSSELEYLRFESETVNS